MNGGFTGGREHMECGVHAASPHTKTEADIMRELPEELCTLTTEHCCAIIGGMIGTLINYSSPGTVLTAIETIYHGRHDLIKQHAQVRAAFLAGLSRAANKNGADEQ